jgi:hypothetical protein
MSNEVRCPHGIVCDYVYRTQYFHGHGGIVVGGDYWHTPYQKCNAQVEPR